jgi:hypothetical protein
VRYHNTKTTVATIIIVVVSLFLVSALGIIYLNAKTPIEAVTEALTENLELPSDYSVEISNINKGFLKKQIIENISIKKNDDTFLSLDDVELNQSILAYIKIFFHMQKILDVKIGNVDIFYNENFSDLGEGFSGLKIKDGTFSLQDTSVSVKEETTPISFSDFRSDIVEKGAIDLSSYFPELLKGIELNIKLEKGNISYSDSSVNVNGIFSTSSIKVDENSYLRSINTGIKNIDFKSSNSNVSFNIEDVEIDIDKTQINLEGTKIIVNSNDLIADLEEASLSYSLLDLESGMFRYKDVNLSYNGLVSNIKSGESKLISNLKDVSLYNTFNSININDKDLLINIPYLEFDASYVDKKTSMIIKSGDNNSIYLNDITDIGFSNLDISITSDQLLPTDVSFIAPNLYLNLDKNLVGFNDLQIVANSNVKSDLLYNEDGTINFQAFTKENLIKSFEDLNISAEGKSYGSVDLLQSDFEGKINSKILLENSFKAITATIDLYDNNLTNVSLPVDISIAYQGPVSLKGQSLKMIEAKVDLGNTLTTNIVSSSKGDILDSNIEANIELDDFNPNSVSFYLNYLTPFISNYISSDTTFNGSFNLSGKLGDDYFLKSKGKIDSSLIINNLVFGKTPINLGLSLSSVIDEQSVEFQKFSINSFGYRLFAAGTYNNNTKIPKLDFDISKIDTGTKMVTAKIFDSDEKLAFELLIPNFENFKFTGAINNFDDKDVNFDTAISFLDDTFPLSVDFNREDYEINANSDENLDFNLKIGRTINAKLSLSDLFIISLDDSYLNGDFTFDFQDVDDWKFKASNFLLKYNKDKIRFGFDTLINNTQIQIENILYQNNSSNSIQTNKYEGSFYYDKGVKSSDMRFTPYSLKMNLGDGRDQNMDIVASTKGYTNHIYIDVNNFNFAPLFQLDDNLIFNLRLIGNRDGLDTNNFSGSVNLYDRILKTETEVVAVKESNRVASDFLFRTLSLLPFIDVSSLEAESATSTINNVISSTNFSFESNIEVENNNYQLSSLNLKTGDINITNSNLSFDSVDKEIDLDSTLSVLKHSKNTNQLSSADLSLKLNFNAFLEHVITLYKTEFVDETNKLDYKSILKNGKRIIDEKQIDYNLLNGIYGSLKLDNISALKDTVDFEKFWDDTKLDQLEFTSIDSAFIVENETVKLEGKNLNGAVDLNEQTANIIIDKDFGIGVNAEIDYSNKSVDLMLNQVYLPLNIISRLIYINSMKFYGGTIKGNLQITNALTNPNFYGTLNLDTAKAKILWLGDQEISTYNAQLIAYDNQFYANDIDVVIYNSEDNKTSHATANLSLDIIKSLPIGFEIEATTEDYVKGLFPIIGYNIWTEGYAKDTFKYQLKNNWSTISGHLIVKDAEVKGELEPLPSWLKASSHYTVDFSIETENNVTINYPSIDNPILKATLEKGQKVNFYVDKKLDEMYAQGTLSIAQGEIFYFQKNFFINNGQIKLDRNSVTNDLDILLSLNATLKEFDSEGNSVDILLTLNNSSLNNINPVFSASPSKTQNEIISILGESLTGSQSSGDVKVSGLATAATSVFSSLGYINTGGVGSLNQTIANTLNLDIFSLSSNIVENLLLDTINIDSSTDNYSPLAKYLNNTSIYMGKYISNTSYFQLIINLLADSSSNSSSFLASDLSLDLEVTYDIDTPLAKFSLFTNPTQLSIIDILDTIGLSVTKTFQLR